MSQIKNLRRWWPKRAEWFVIGGPAVMDEAQIVKRKYPFINCIGFEPNPISRYKQSMGEVDGVGGRFPGKLSHCALWERDEYVQLITPKGHTFDRSSICRPYPIAPDIGAWEPGDTYEVPGITLDSASRELGPFKNIVLWIDIEYAELPALRGAKEMLDRTLLVNLETYEHLYLGEITTLLGEHGLFQVGVWNVTETPLKDAQDYVFARR